MTSYRHFRLYVVANGGGNRCDMAELKIFVGATQYPTSAMTSNSAPSPLVASASSFEAAGNEAYRAFDRTSTQWSSQLATGSEWVKLDLGSGNAVEPSSFKIKASGVADRAPSSFRLEGSNTGSFSGEETTLYSTSGLSWSAGQERSFSIPVARIFAMAGSGAFSGTRAAVVNTDFAMAGAASTAISPQITRESVFAMAGAGAFSARGAAVKSASYAMTGSSDLSMFGARIRAASFAMAGVSQSAFQYDRQPITSTHVLQMPVDFALAGEQKDEKRQRITLSRGLMWSIFRE